MNQAEGSGATPKIGAESGKEMPELLPEGYALHPEGYLWRILPIESFSALPETVEVDGYSLRKKTEFHITVINARGFARKLSAMGRGEENEIEIKILSLLAVYVQKHPIALTEFIDDIRLAQTSERTSLAARCRVANLNGFFEELNATFGTEFLVQEPHVSLYTRTGAAVGIDTEVEIEAFKKVQLPHIQNILSEVK